MPARSRKHGARQNALPRMARGASAGFAGGVIAGAILAAMLFLWQPQLLRLVSESLPESAPVQRGPAAVEEQIEVYFSPRGGATDAIVRELDAARESVQVMAYSFTSAPIAEAVARAHQRGVKVTVILDKSQQTAQYSSATYLFNHQVPVFIDDRHAIQHNKVILIDGGVIITGSFNFSRAAEERNAENLLVIRGRPGIMAAYQRDFAHHLGHSQPYRGPGR